MVSEKNSNLIGHNDIPKLIKIFRSKTEEKYEGCLVKIKAETISYGPPKNSGKNNKWVQDVHKFHMANGL